MSSPAARVITLFKASYRRWLTREQIADVIGLEHKSASAWLDDLVEAGMFVERPGTKKGPRVRAPAEFTLSRAWGGEADV